ncbi:MAG: adenylate/guanylate cyclase domain-containing protein [Xanthobacteraceae bacterium]
MSLSPIPTRATTDLAEWLASYGLDRYAQAFAENNIEFSILPDLTENDLEKLGVTLGHRKTLLRAIAALTATAQTPDIPITAAPVSVAPPREDELRQITVLFCDLVGSTQLSEKLDPEDLRRLIDAYREACSTAVRRYDGEVASYVGDGVMAFFGWPRAHEDDAARAVHTALETLHAVTNISGPVTLASRVGICSGPVVVRDIGAGPTAGVLEAVGETPNIAARLQALATPNSVLISESTKLLLSGAFDLQDIGSREIKGISRPLHIYRVLAAKSSANRFEAAHGGVLSPLIGRSIELSLILDRWQKTKEADGQIILLSGSAGVGKSRLIHELKSNIHDESHFLLNHQCSPYHSQSAFFPIIEQITQAARITTRDAAADKLAKLKAYFSTATDNSTELTLLIAKLLSIPAENNHELSQLTSQQIKNRTIAKLVDMLLALSARRPTLCLFEDVHWIDPSTLEFLEHAISRIDHARILFVISCRPEFRTAWSSRANVTTHSVTRLSRSEVVSMVKDLSSGTNMSPKVIDEIIDKADGMPLFIEELTRSIKRTLVRPELGKADSGQPAQSAATKVPETLYDALMERLDRVAPGHRVAQIAAAIGREFSYDLLFVATGIGDTDLDSALSVLEQADIIYRVDVSPSVRFAFKHALLRDAIYNSLLRSRRQEIHAGIARILESHFKELVESQPEIVAHHYGEAGNHQLAANYWRAAGSRAFANSANVEAIANFQKALALLAALPESPERDKQESEIQLALGIPLIAVRGYASAETREAFARARALSLKLNDTPNYIQALYGLWGHSWMGGRHDEALSMANEFLSRSAASSDPVPAIVAHRVMGSTLLTSGEFQSAREHFEKTIALSNVAGQQALYSLYMVEPRVASLLLLSWNLWFLGYPDQALSRVSEALSLARDLSQPYTVAFANYMTSVVHLFRGDPDHALASAEQSLEMSKEQRFSLYVVLSIISRGRALGELGRLDEAKIEIERGVDEGRQTGIGFMLPMMESWLADVHAQAGENEAALSIVEQSLRNLDVTGRAWEAELYCRRAQFQLALDSTRASDAESDLKKAIAIARHQCAKSLELRAANALATLWRTQERVGEARSLIEPIYSWFSEGADTADLLRAREILAT